MANPLRTVSGCRARVPALQHAPSLHRLFPAYYKPVPDENVSLPQSEKITFLRDKEFDLTGSRVPNIIVCTSILWRADKPGSRTPGFTDGAKIHLCNRRCCFLTWKGRSCLLYRLSPRKSRFQSHPPEM